MSIIETSFLIDSGVEIFSTLTEAQLRNRTEPDKGLLIVKSPKIIHVALNTGHELLALLCEQKHITGDAAGIIERCDDIPVYTGERKLLTTLTGYTLMHGVLYATRRWVLSSVEEVCRKARRTVVIEDVVDAISIGAIFCPTAALGIDAILLTRNSCDPSNRRAVRVSMGSVFLILWIWLGGSLNELRKLGFRTVTMAFTEKPISIDNPILAIEPKLAIIMGTEGDGLQNEIINEADYVVHIPMANSVDPLNVVAASAVTFWQLRAQNDATLPPLSDGVHI